MTYLKEFQDGLTCKAIKRGGGGSGGGFSNRKLLWKKLRPKQ